MEKYINISKASSSSLIERVGASTTLNSFVPINKVAEAKGLKSNRSLRIAIQKGKYIAREVTVFGGTSYEILYSSLEPEVQEILENEEIKSTALVPLNNTPRPSFISESARLTALAKVDIINALENLRNKYPTKKEADSIFIDLYNSGQYLPQVYNFLGSISIGTVKHYLKLYKESGEDYRALIPNYKVAKQGEYNSILTDEMKKVFINYLLHPNKFKIGKAITLTMHILEKRGIENIPCKLSFRRYAEHFKKNNYAKWVLMREGEKAYHDKVEAYIERDISLINVGDVIIADGHVLNFQVINPFTGKPTRATLVGFLDWKSTALVGYEIMMTENTQCIASALRNSILNLGVIPKVVYQDNGRAFKSKYFQHTDFDEEGFNGVYANLGIHSVFAKPYNARAKVIERFFLEFQEEFEKMMPSYIGTSIENRPAHLNRNEKLHKEMHKKLTGNKILTVQEAIQFINCWLDFHNSKPCPNNPQMTIKQVLNTVQKQDIDINILNDLMMKTEVRTINKHGITFLNMHYRSDCLLGLREQVYVRYSLFDLSKLYVYSVKGEFLCVARRVQKVHPMANVLGTVKDMEEYKQAYKKQQRQFSKLKGLFKLAPAKAIRYFKSKGNTHTWDWYELWQDAHKKSFTVAKVMREDVLKDIRSALDKSLSEGKTFHEFQKELKPILQKKGWWGEQIVVDSQGVAEKVQLGSMYRLKTIYSVNMQVAYQTGRYTTQMENVDNRPYWQYVAVMDSSTRPEHAQLNGLVYRYDDPFWKAFYPPNGWRCRCRVNTLSNYSLQKHNIPVSNSNGCLSEEQHLVSKKSGEYRPVTVYTDPLTGKKIAPDVGWSHNPASGLVTKK